MASSTLANLVVRIVGDTSKFVSALETTEKKTSRFAAAHSRLLKGAGIAGATALAGIGFAAVKMATDTDRGLREVQTLLPQLSEQGFGRLRQDVFDFSEDVGIATNQVVPALYQAISAGIPQENVFEFLQSASDLSIGGITELRSATDLLSSAVNAFGKEAGSTQDVTDSFFTAVRLGKTTVEEIAASFSTVAPLASATGISLDEVNASLASLTLVGQPTSEAFTNIRAAIVSLQRTTPAMEKALAELGFTGKMAGQDLLDERGLIGALQALREVSDRTGVPLIEMTGRVQGAQAILGLTGDAAERTNTILAEFANKSGAGAQAVDIMNQSLSRQFEIAKNNLNVALQEAATRILPDLVEVVQKLADILPHVVEAFVALGESIVRVLKPIIQPIADTFEVVIDVLNRFGISTEKVEGKQSDLAKAGLFLRDVNEELLFSYQRVGPAVGDATRAYLGLADAIVGSTEPITVFNEQVANATRRWVDFTDAGTPVTDLMETINLLAQEMGVEVSLTADQTKELVRRVRDGADPLRVLGSLTGEFTDGLSDADLAALGLNNQLRVLNTQYNLQAENINKNVPRLASFRSLVIGGAEAANALGNESGDAAIQLTVMGKAAELAGEALGQVSQGGLFFIAEIEKAVNEIEAMIRETAAIDFLAQSIFDEARARIGFLNNNVVEVSRNISGGGGSLTNAVGAGEASVESFNLDTETMIDLQRQMNDLLKRESQDAWDVYAFNASFASDQVIDGLMRQAAAQASVIDSIRAASQALKTEGLARLLDETGLALFAAELQGNTGLAASLRKQMEDIRRQIQLEAINAEIASLTKMLDDALTDDQLAAVMTALRQRGDAAAAGTLSGFGFTGDELSSLSGAASLLRQRELQQSTIIVQFNSDVFTTTDDLTTEIVARVRDAQETGALV